MEEGTGQELAERAGAVAAAEETAAPAVAAVVAAVGWVVERVEGRLND